MSTEHLIALVCVALALGVAAIAAFRPKPCPWCDGTGRFGDPENDRACVCSICGGKGKLRI